MAERAWNKKQEEVIKHRGGDLIVSAAAGSGKTAVLVERILGLITDEDDPVDIDDILVVTFTNAAASDMKSKIAKEIDKRLANDPSNGRLSLQSALVQNAIITTIDSFCGYVVKNYFSVAGLEPGYKVGDEEELSIMAEEVMDATMAEFYESKDSDFRKLVRSYGNAKGDDEVRRMVMKLVTNSESHTDPTGWLSHLADCYDVTDLDAQPWMEDLLALVKNTLTTVRSELEKGLEISKAEGGPYHYRENFESDIETVDSLLNAETYPEIYKLISVPKLFMDLNKKRPKDVDEDLKAKAKNIRDGAKAPVEKIRKKFFSVSPARQRSNLKKAKPVVEALSRLAIAYTENMMREKQKRKMYGFSDIEHFALDILTHEEKGEDGSKVNPIACAFGRKFREVMIDEYQDSNDVQETILSRISEASEGHCKRFMVGDVKQSIYGFRLAKPEIFLEKEREYSDPSNDKKRIVLSKNYRSDHDVLDSTNLVFENIMKADIAKIDYDDDARLNQGNFEFDVRRAAFRKTELLLGYMDAEDEETGEDNDDTDACDDGSDPADRDKQTFEAKMIADRILKLKALRDENGSPLFKNSDIAILGRSFKKNADVLMRVLAAAGINAHLTRDTGYFSETEVKDIITMLEVIDNPRVDIPLYGALLSPCGRMQPEDVAKVRVFAREKAVKTGLFDEVSLYINEGDDEEVRDLLVSFTDRLQVYRRAAHDTCVRDLIEILIDDNGYREYISAKPAGKRRIANVDMLENLAAKYDESTAGGLFRFVRHIRQMRTYQMDYGEAGNVSEEDDVVRIMTIHKSKGLQFPVVILAGTDSKFSRSDSRAKLKCSEKYGAAISAVNIRKRVKYRNILNELIGEITDRSQKAEEMRVLYVAMTRAEEKLIIVGPVRPEDKRVEDEDTGGITDFEVMSADCYADWIEPVARSRRDLFDIVEYTAGDLKTVEEEGAEKNLFNTASVIALGSSENKFTEEIRQRIEFEYRYLPDIRLRQKVSVSEVKKPDYEKQMYEEGAAELIRTEKKKYIPKFVMTEEEGKEGHGAAYGTSVHRFMELLDYGVLPDDESQYAASLKKQIKDICDEGLMDPEAADSINLDRICVFLRSELGREMRDAFAAGRLKREAPFVMEVPAKDIYPDLDTQETILVQGIIDAYYIRDDGIVVVDYKTDSLTEESEFTDRYHRQLELYGEALSKATGKQVAGLYIYSFRMGRSISVSRI
ncbi:MAG: helicase-exonuclease AddAB subunit AddA [Lachnospiraceae bacterium]|nr:helicase-exonuclease AddAB subunit AddA [Lachnospiraceae bacterium]